jgi:hypothetical protein
MEMQFNNLIIRENEKYRICKSSDYNFIFNKQTGFFARWGKNKNDDPICAPSPEILDLEISTGECLGNCKFCYKCNGSGEPTENMSLETFDKIIDKFPHAISEYILVTLEDGKQIKIFANKDVKLISGETKKARDLTEEDEISI